MILFIVIELVEISIILLTKQNNLFEIVYIQGPPANQVIFKC